MKKRKIVFYCGFPPPIILYKIAKSLREKGHHITIFTMAEETQFNLEFNKNAFNQIFYSDFQFSKEFFKNNLSLKKIASLMKFLFKMKTINADVVIGLAGNNWQLKIAHKYFFKRLPFIYFPYDILSLFHNSKKEALNAGIKKFELNAEKYCFEKLDGIIHKGDPDELNRFNELSFYKANLQRLQLSFFPYCSKEFSVYHPLEKLSKTDKEFHLVYPGFLLNISENFNEISDTLNKILSQKIHLYMYGLATHISKTQSKDYFSNTFKEFLKNKYFHLHDSLGPKEIVKEISKYDFGFYWTYMFDYPEVKLHTSNKISTFLEAGLPMIYHEDCKFIGELMDSYGLKVPYNKHTLKNLKNYLIGLNKPKLIENVKKARIDFDIDKNIPRFEQFIEEVISSKSN